MARDHAQISLHMWADDDWRRLSPRAQHLYLVLLTSPSLSFCGVADWRPARLAALAAGWDVAAVNRAAAELVDRLYLVIDEDTEEALIRSFVRHDGLMKQPNMATAMATAHAAVASSRLRGVVVHELRRLREEQPDLPGWRSSRALGVLDRASIDPSGDPSDGPSPNPSGKGSATPPPKGSGDPSDDPCPTPAPSSLLLAPSSKELVPRKRGHRIPHDFAITEELHTWARARGFNAPQIVEMTERFVDHWTAATGATATKADWHRAWRNWVAKEDPSRVRGATTAPAWNPVVTPIRGAQREDAAWNP